MSDANAGAEQVKCRWCGQNQVERGYETCPVCHRIQNPFWGRLQVWNASSWLAIFVAIIAIYYSHEQVDLARSEVEEARNERFAAEDAVAEAKKAVNEARLASKQAQRALKQAAAARDEAQQGMVHAEDASENAETAYERAKSALKEVKSVGRRVDVESGKVKRLSIGYLRMSANDKAFTVEQACKEAPNLAAEEILRNYNDERSGAKEAFQKMLEGLKKQSSTAQKLWCRVHLAQVEPELEQLLSETVDHERNGIDVSQVRHAICRLARKVDRHDGTDVSNLATKYCD